MSVAAFGTKLDPRLLRSFAGGPCGASGAALTPIEDQIRRECGETARVARACRQASRPAAGRISRQPCLRQVRRQASPEAADPTEP
ncbi:hypothetical protein CR492_05965 [Methylocella silvestris]|uniref:Uncharacterized protein n=1 Tax=Methylocella silvestris TaxID=199596 RepID=A0A2J7TJA8_METSI|nr:hypothetical protein CR492_05965 [Methylocella silvestris]